MHQYINKVILPYICNKRKDLKLPIDWPTVLIFDNFKKQCTSELLTLLDDNNINVILIPPNCTDRLQPLDLSVIKAAKEFLRRKFNEWYICQANVFAIRTKCKTLISIPSFEYCQTTGCSVDGRIVRLLER